MPEQMILSEDSLGLHVLHNPGPNAHADLVAVHGLGGDSFSTWTHSNGVMWLRDLLPRELPSIRIMTFGYNANILTQSRKQRSFTFAEDLISALDNKRAGELRSRPLILVAHSLGGIVVKKAIVICHNRSDSDLFNGIQHVLFFGTPHHGTSGAVNFLRNLGASFGFARTSSVVRELELWNPQLVEAMTLFSEVSNAFKITTYWEREKTRGITVVDEASARLYQQGEQVTGLVANHSTMCKFPAASDSKFQMVTSRLMAVIEDARVQERVRAHQMEVLTTIELLKPLSSTLEDLPLLRNRYLIGSENRSLQRQEIASLKGERSYKGSELSNEVSNLEIRSMSDLMLTILRRYRDEEKTKFQSWLGADLDRNRIDMCRKDRDAGTCSWILERKVYIEWASSNFPQDSAKFLWIHGVAGFGKSVLCAFIVDTLVASQKSPVFHYFFPLTSAHQPSPIDVLASWIGQMVDQNEQFLDAAMAAVRQSPKKPTDMTLWTLFTALVKKSSGNVFVVDGFDEFEPFDETRKVARRETRHNFLRDLKQVLTGHKCYVLIVSRAEADIRSQLSTKPVENNHITLLEYEIRQEDVENDVLSFARTVVGLRLANKSIEIREEIARKLSLRCKGMFLWINLQKPQIRSGKNRLQLLSIIEDSPGDLDKIYDRDLKKILQLPEADRSRAIRLLSWATYASRPLTIAETTEALAIYGPNIDITESLPDSIDNEYVNSELNSLCGSLIEIRQNQPSEDLAEMTIHLKHFSVREFLIRSEMRLQISDLLTPTLITEKNNKLAIDCLCYLQCSSVIQNLRTSVPPRAFVDYAVKYWLNHVSKDGHQYPELSKMAREFFAPDNSTWSLWRDRFENNGERNHSDPQDSVRRNDERAASRVYYAALFGLQDVVDYLCFLDPKAINVIGGHYGTPIKAACAAGHFELVHRMLELGAQLYVSEGLYGSILGAAAFCGSVELCELLLAKAVDIQLPDSSGRTPLHFACKKGDIDIVRLLLNNGANYNCRDAKGYTPLFVAVEFGHIEILRLLHEKGATPQVSDIEGLTPLHSASNEGYKEIVQMLLNYSVDVNSQSKDLWTPVCLASHNGFFHIVDLLIESGADLMITDKEGWTALHLAVVGGHVKLTQLLLDKGANLHTCSSGDLAPLHSAANNGQKEMVKLLLSRGADPSVPNGLGWTPLNLASRNGHLDVVKMLLGQGPHQDVANRDGITPVNSAAFKGHLSVVQLLLTSGADPNIAQIPKFGLTPLGGAADQGHLDIVRYLLDHGADLTLEYKNSHPLLVASQQGYLEIVQLLLSKGAHPDISNSRGSTSLHLSTEMNHTDIVQLLLKHSANVGAQTSRGWTPLIIAASLGKLGIAKLLLEHGAEVDAPSNLGSTPLHEASHRGYTSIVELLLTYSVNIEYRDIYSRTPLHLAVLGNQLEVATMLLKRKCNSRALTDLSESALHLACRNSSADLIQLLLTFSYDPFELDDFGRSPFDWMAQNDNLDSTKLPWALNIHLTPKPASDKALLVGIQRLLSKPPRNIRLHVLGKMLVYADDKTNALTAFKQEIFGTNVNFVHEATCNRCEAMIENQSRFVCMSCFDVDFCQSCLDKLNGDKRNWFCNTHKFLKVCYDASVCWDERDEGYQDWLESWLKEVLRAFKLANLPQDRDKSLEKFDHCGR